MKHARKHAWLTITVAAACLVPIEPRIAVIALLGVGLIGVWMWPGNALEIAVAGVLAVRPTIDAFGGRAFGQAVLNVNVAAIFGLVVLAVAVVFATYRASIGKSIWPDPALRRAHIWLAVAYGVALFSGARLYGSVGLGTGVRELLRVVSIVGAFLLVLWWVGEDPQNVRKGWMYLFAGLVPPVLVAGWQWLAGTGNLETEGINRLQGTLSHPNSFGLYLIPFIMVLVAGIRSSNGLARAVRLIGALVLALLVVLTYSRTALLVLGVGMATLPVLQARRFGWKSLVGGGAVVALLLMIGWLVGGHLIESRFNDVTFARSAIDEAAVGESENSLTWRFINWGILVALGRQTPVMGHGAGMTTVLNPLISPYNGVPYNAHNDWVRFFFEGGLIGLVAYFFYCLQLCMWAVGGARRAATAIAPTAYGIVAALIAMMFLSLGTTEISSNTVILYEVYGMLALVAASTASKNPVSPALVASVEA